MAKKDILVIWTIVHIIIIIIQIILALNEQEKNKN